MSHNNKLLTPLELKVMNILWKLKKAFVKEIRGEWDGEDAEKPAYNTISTTVRILEDKEYIDHQAFGRTHQYFPKVSRFAYQKRLMGHILDNAFSGSTTSLISALIDNKKVSDEDIQEIEDLIKKEKS